MFEIHFLNNQKQAVIKVKLNAIFKFSQLNHLKDLELPSRQLFLCL